MTTPSARSGQPTRRDLIDHRSSRAGAAPSQKPLNDPRSTAGR